VNVLENMAAQMLDNTSPLLQGVVTTHLDTEAGFSELSYAPGVPDGPEPPYVVALSVMLQACGACVKRSERKLTYRACVRLRERM